MGSVPTADTDGQEVCPEGWLAGWERESKTRLTANPAWTSASWSLSQRGLRGICVLLPAAPTRLCVCARVGAWTVYEDRAYVFGPYFCVYFTIIIFIGLHCIFMFG